MIFNPAIFKNGGEKDEYRVELSGSKINVDIKWETGKKTYTSAQTITVPAGTWCVAHYLKANNVNAKVSFNGETQWTEPPSPSNSYALDYKFPVFRDCKIDMEEPSGFGNIYIYITTS